MNACRSVSNAASDATDVREDADASASHDTHAACPACRRVAAERARYHELFTSSRDACVVTDAKGVIRDANRRAGEMLGMAPSALHRKLLIAFVARGDTRAFRKSLGSVGELARTGTPVRVRMRARGRAPFDAVLWVDGGSRSSSDEAPLYRWTIHPATRGAADESGLHALLGAVAQLARALPGEPTFMVEVAPDDGTARIGDSVAKAIQSMSVLAERRKVRFVVDGGDVPDHVHAFAPRLDDSIAALLRTALDATPDGAALHIGLLRNEAEAVLDVHVGGAAAGSVGSPLSVVMLATRLAADGGRLEIGGREGQPLMRVSWPALEAVTSWRS